jgi:hypothetical protein
VQIRGTAALDEGGEAGFYVSSCTAQAWCGGNTSVSCPSAGSCTTGGTFSGSSGVEGVFTADESTQNWSDAQQLPDSEGLNQGNANIYTVTFSQRLSRDHLVLE